MINLRKNQNKKILLLYKLLQMEKKTFTMENKQYELIYDKHIKKEQNIKKEKNIEDYFKKNINTDQKKKI